MAVPYRGTGGRAAAPAGNAAHLAGSDEQGFYWSAEGVLPAQAFRTAFGRVPRVGGILPGNAFLYDVSEPAFGAAFPVPAGAGVPTAAGFGTFVVVPY